MSVPPQGNPQHNGWNQPQGHWPAPQQPQQPQGHWPTPQQQPPAGYPPCAQQPGQPYSAGPPYTAGPQPPQQRRKRGPWPVILGIVLVLALGGGLGWGAIQLFGSDDDSDATAAPSAPPSAAPTEDPTGGETSDEGADPTGEASDGALPDDPAEALRQRIDTDASAVAADIEGSWVPQLSSKKVGLEAEGRTWDEQAILDEHERLREEHPRVKLLWSGDYASFKSKDFYVTIVGITFDDPDQALAWCGSHGLDADSCYAKKISTTGGHDGTTKTR